MWLGCQSSMLQEVLGCGDTEVCLLLLARQWGASCSPDMFSSPPNYILHSLCGLASSLKP